jgi:hypothetical protein
MWRRDDACNSGKPQDAGITQHSVSGACISNYMHIKRASCFPRTVKSHSCVKRNKVIAPKTLNEAEPFPKIWQSLSLYRHYPTFYGTRSFIAVNTTANYWTLSWDKFNTIHTLILYLLKIHFNIILLSKPWSPTLNLDQRTHSAL